MVKQKITPLNNPVRQTHLSRLYFLCKGCKQASLESTGGKVLWANGEQGYFMSANGVKKKLGHGPAMRKKGRKANSGKRGFVHPIICGFKTQNAHRLMFETFAEEPCPIFKNSKGKPYKGIVHHVIENPNDIRMDNLMGWLTYEQHAVADKRRRALEDVLPDMYCIETKRLKTMQDPRKTNDELFKMELNYLRLKYGTKDNL